MKKLFCFFIVIVISISLIKIPGKVYAENTIYLLGNSECNQVLEQKNMYKKVPIASITKLMTAYICYQKIQEGVISFKDKVYISENASEVEPSKAYLIKDNFYLLEDLFKVMIIKSANDCAIAIAEHISGSETAFSKIMNDTAFNLGMKSSKYTNASGLATPTQYSTAYDQYLLFQNILKIDAIVNILKSPSIKFNNGEEEKIFYSTNKLLNNNIIGKTGYTLEAKNCFCGYKINQNLIYITLGNESSEIRFSNVVNAFDNASRNYHIEQLINNNTKYKKYNLAENMLEYANQNTFSVLVKNGEKSRYNVIEKFYSFNKFPIKKGDVVGESLVLFNNKIIKKEKLIATNNVKRISIFTNLKRIIES